MTDHDDAPSGPAASEFRSALQGHGRPPVFAPIPVDWTVLGDEEAAKHLRMLADWLEWLVWRYCLDSRIVPECWPQHGSLIEELSALRTAWVLSFASTSPGTSPLDWHQAFAHARQRLTDWVARIGCRPGEHRPEH